MEILGKILGSPARVKIMRLFLVNRGKLFTSKEVAQRVRVTGPTAARELRVLAGAQFIKRRQNGWAFNTSFKYVNELDSLLINSDTLDKETIASTFKKAGRVKFLAVSGVFIKNKESRVDLLLVGDSIKKGRVDEAVRRLESEIGAELVYAVFDTKEFNYRLSMYDKLVRDILDYPHEVVFQAKDLNIAKMARLKEPA